MGVLLLLVYGVQGRSGGEQERSGGVQGRSATGWRREVARRQVWGKEYR